MKSPVILGSYIFSFIIVCVHQVAFAACPVIDLPMKFIEKEDGRSLGTVMHLKEKDKEFGKIDEKIWNVATVFDLLAADGKKVAHAEENFSAGEPPSKSQTARKAKSGQLKNWFGKNFPPNTPSTKFWMQKVS